MKIYILAAIVFGLILTVGCKKNLLEKNNYFHLTDSTSSSYIKVYDATLSTSRNYVYVDNMQITGSGLAFGSIFPVNIGYAAINPGNRNIFIKDTIITTTQFPITFNQNFAAGKFYSIFTYDTIGSIKYTVVPDDLTVPADTTSRLRFANMVYSKTPIPNVDIYSFNLSSNIFSNVSVGSVTNFIPHPSKVVDSFFVQETGTSNRLAALVFTPGSKRIYTLVFRGRYQSTTAPLVKVLTLYTNR